MILGDPEYYDRFGFVPAERYGAGTFRGVYHWSTALCSTAVVTMCFPTRRFWCSAARMAQLGSFRRSGTARGLSGGYISSPSRRWSSGSGDGFPAPVRQGFGLPAQSVLGGGVAVSFRKDFHHRLGGFRGYRRGGGMV